MGKPKTRSCKSCGRKISWVAYGPTLCPECLDRAKEEMLVAAKALADAIRHVIDELANLDPEAREWVSTHLPSHVARSTDDQTVADVTVETWRDSAGKRVW